MSGLSGPIEVNGKSYDGVMPPVDYLEDEEIAQILTYIRKEFGDNAPPVGSYYVKQGRYFAKKKKEEQKGDL